MHHCLTPCKKNLIKLLEANTGYSLEFFVRFGVHVVQIISTASWVNDCNDQLKPNLKKKKIICFKIFKVFQPILFLVWFQYSVGAVALLFVHELGHYVALKAYGLNQTVAHRWCDLNSFRNMHCFYGDKQEDYGRVYNIWSSQDLTFIFFHNLFLSLPSCVKENSPWPRRDVIFISSQMWEDRVARPFAPDPGPIVFVPFLGAAVQMNRPGPRLVWIWTLGAVSEPLPRQR